MFNSDYTYSFLILYKYHVISVVDIKYLNKQNPRLSDFVILSKTHTTRTFKRKLIILLFDNYFNDHKYSSEHFILLGENARQFIVNVLH